MLEMEVLESRTVYRYSATAIIEIQKIDLDWGWCVKVNGRTERGDVVCSEKAAERAAIKAAREC